MAQSAILELVVQLQDQASKGLKATSAAVADVGKQAEKTHGILQGVLTGVGFAAFNAGLSVVSAGIHGMTGLLGDAVQESRDAAKGLAQTQAAIKSTGGAANVTADQIVDLAGSLSHLTLFTDDAIQQQENLLLTFTNVQNKAGEGNDIFTQATKIGLDMAQALGTDAAGGAVALGKALNDPVKGITALTRVGVTFTKQQQEQIKTAQAAGKTLDAQKIILAELTKEFGGSAKAAAEADGGFHLFNQRLADVEQTIGDALMPAITGVMGILSGPFLDAVETVGTALAGKISEGIAWLAETGLPALEKVWSDVSSSFQFGGAGLAIQSLIDDIGRFIPALKPVTDFISRNFWSVWDTTASAIGIARDAFITFTQAFSGNWVDASGILPFHQAVGEVGLALGDFSRWIVDIGTKLASSDWSGALDTLTTGIKNFGATIGTAVSTWADQFIAWVPGAISQLEAALPGIWNTVSTWIAAQAGPIATQLAAWGQAFLDWIGPKIPPFLEAVGAFGVAIGTSIVQSLPGIAAQTQLWASALVDWVQTTAIPAISPAMSSFITTLEGEMGRAGTAMVDAGAKVGKGTVDAMEVGWSSAPAAVNTLIFSMSKALDASSPVFWAAVEVFARASVTLMLAELEKAIPLVIAWGGRLAQAILFTVGPGMYEAAIAVGKQTSDSMWTALHDGLLAFGPALMALGASIIGFIHDGLVAASNIIGDAARQIGQSILDNILSPLSGLAGRIAAIVQGAIASAAGAAPAKPRPPVVGGIHSQSFGATEVYGSDESTSLHQSIDQFVKDADYVMQKLSEVAAKYTSEGLKAATEYADAAGRIFSTIGAGIKAFADLKDYRGVAQSSLDWLGADMISVTNKMIDVANHLDKDGVAAAAVFAEAEGKIVGPIGAAIDAFGKINDYKGVLPNMLDWLGADTRLVVEKMIDVADNLDQEGVAAAAAFAEKEGVIASAIKATVEGFSSINDYAGVAPEKVQLLVDDSVKITKLTGDMSYQAGAAASGALDWQNHLEAYATRIKAGLNSIASLDGLTATATIHAHTSIVYDGGGGGTNGGTDIGNTNTSTGSSAAPGSPGGKQRLPGRASGGPVTAGVPYIVGEYRPELFVPSQSGYIAPSVSGGTTITFNEGAIIINAQPGQDGAALARQLYPELRSLIDRDDRLAATR